jgi:hypothetical protein
MMSSRKCAAEPIKEPSATTRGATPPPAETQSWTETGIGRTWEGGAPSVESLSPGGGAREWVKRGLAMRYTALTFSWGCSLEGCLDQTLRASELSLNDDLSPPITQHRLVLDVQSIATAFLPQAAPDQPPSPSRSRSGEGAWKRARSRDDLLT